MTKFFVIIYVMIALIVAGLILNSYSDCHRMRWPNLTPSAPSAGMTSLFGGASWPITLPGMLVLYNEKENRFCMN